MTMSRYFRIVVLSFRRYCVRQSSQIQVISMSKKLQPLTDKAMLAAVRSKDSDFDGKFVFGVVTTGIFCKPSCPARPAKIENIRFFIDGTLAMEAGFRACKRCHPELTNDIVEKLVSVSRYIEKHAEDKITLKDLAALSKLSISQLQRNFKSTFGVTPKAYQDQYRLDKFKASLRSGKAVTDAIYDSGFGSPSRVYGETTRNIGMAPKAYREGGKGESISYAHRTTSLGNLLMAATDKGICFAQFGGNVKGLLNQLRQEFPYADINRSSVEIDHELDQWMNELDKYLRSDVPKPDLPLDLRGTAFQIKVWKFLLCSKVGDVYSYGELAEGIDKPTATRAAASACGKNRIAVLVPCHRVLRGDGSIGGYRWGIERKRALLDLEREKKARHK